MRSQEQKLSQERLAGPDQARGWNYSGCNRTKSDQRLVSQLTSRSSRARFAVSSRTHSPDAGRLNSGVRQRTAVIRDLEQLLASMEPSLNPGTYAFVAAPSDLQISPDQIIASVREPEGHSLVIPEQLAHELGLPVTYSAAWITLTVHSDLAAVGLTAAFSGALGQAGISCNVIAGVHHDHLFVPADQAQQAMAVLFELQRAAA